VSRHETTLAAIFATPTRANVKWADIESLIRHLGGVVANAEGSRVNVLLNGVVGHFHRPHPSPDTDKGALKSVKRFLENAGVAP
jgi:hypothetical protein